MKRITIIGNLGLNKTTCSGQIIRTRILYNALIDHYGRERIYVIDTDNYSSRALIIILKAIKSLFISDIYIVMVSLNGRKYFLPVLYFFQRYLSKKVLNNIIGGNYSTSVQNFPSLIKCSNFFSVNWVQTALMKKEIEQLGIYNVEILPNSKPLTIVKKESFYSQNDPPFHFCTFSRVSKAKGIDIAIKAIEQINSEAKKTIAELTIFGKPDEDFEKEFQLLLSTSTDAIHYGGIIGYDKTVETLRNYFMLLFPTTYYGEGFPGTVIDAYFSGTPVIASDWKFNCEVIKDRITGYIYNHKDYNELLNCIKMAIDNPIQIATMRNNCVKEAEKYTLSNVMPIVFRKIDSLQR